MKTKDGLIDSKNKKQQATSHTANGGGFKLFEALQSVHRLVIPARKSLAIRFMPYCKTIGTSLNKRHVHRLKIKIV